MEEAIRAELLATAALAAIVGRKVDWGVRPQGAALPAVTLHLIDAAPDLHLRGPSGWHRGRVQVDCWSRTYKGARDMADIIAGDGGVLNGRRAVLGGVRVRAIVLDRSSDSDTDSTGVLHRARIDLNLWWNAS